MKHTIVLKTCLASQSTIMIGDDLRGEFHSLLQKIKPTKTVFITDETMMSSLRTFCSPHKKTVFVLKSGESEKNFDNLKRIIQFFFEQQIDKKSLVVAFGGGVITDITGFAASIFYRGVPILSIPTTFLAQVDAAIGGKNTINFNETKNVLGTISQPRHILIDIELLKSLPKRQMNSGMAEIIKYGIGFDSKLFSDVESIQNLDPYTLFHLIKQSVEIKVGIVTKDQDETKGERKLLNLGHTLGHSLEAQKSLKLTHGEAVSIGLVFSAFISKQLGNISNRDLEKIKKVIEAFSLPTWIYFDIETTLKNISYDKKKSGGMIDFVVINKIGRSYIKKVDIEEITKFLIEFKNLSKGQTLPKHNAAALSFSNIQKIKTKVNSIYLVGFRATGKSTIGPLLAKKLNWKFIEMDKELEKIAGKSIPELTKYGSSWLRFRSLEHQLLKNLLKEKNIVVSTGGGLGVNDVENNEVKKTFGEINKDMLTKNGKNLIVLLTASEKVIEARIREMEIKSKTTLRPILNMQKAAKVDAYIKNLDKSQKKNYLIREIVNDSLNLYKKRKKLYDSLTKNVVDTGLLSVDETVDKIISLL